MEKYALTALCCYLLAIGSTLHAKNECPEFHTKEERDDFVKILGTADWDKNNIRKVFHYENNLWYMEEGYWNILTGNVLKKSSSELLEITLAGPENPPVVDNKLRCLYTQTRTFTYGVSGNKVTMPFHMTRQIKDTKNQ